MLQLSLSGRPVLVSPARVEALERHQGRTTIVLFSGNKIQVDESIEDLVDMLKVVRKEEEEID